MLDLAKHIVEGKTGEFDPERFEDHYESALADLISRKRAGEKIKAPSASRESGNVINLMDALRQSLKGDAKSARRPARTHTRATKKQTRSKARARKAG